MPLPRTLPILTLALALAAGTALAETAKDKAKAPQKRAEKAAPASTEKGRDWTLIDTNKDGYISPEEMEAWLKANPGPQR